MGSPGRNPGRSRGLRMMVNPAIPIASRTPPEINPERAPGSAHPGAPKIGKDWGCGSARQWYTKRDSRRHRGST